MSAHNMAKRTAAGTLALAVCLGGGALAAAGAASADSNFSFNRVAAGADRFDTAVLSSKTAFPNTAQAGGVVLVNGWRSVDGLTASSLAGAYQASILYTEKDEVPQAVRDEINRLGTKNIWLVGGTSVLSDKLESSLKSAGFTVNRVGGSDRYETAAKISDATMQKTGKKPAHAFVASGVDGNLSDSTVVAPIAYATGSPILLSEPGDAPNYTTDQLDDIKGASIFLIGGKGALTDAVYNEVGAKERFAGVDRGQTANFVADWAKANVGFSKANAALVGAKNDNVADSLAAAAFLGNSRTNIHYAGLDTTNTYLKDHSAELTGKGWVIGGKSVVSDEAVVAAQTSAANKSATNPLPPQSSPPTITGATVTGAQQVTLSMSKSVTAQGGSVDATQFQYDADGFGTGAPSLTGDTATVTGGTGTSIVINFASPINSWVTTDTFRYVDTNTSLEAGDIRDTMVTPLATASLGTVADGFVIAPTISSPALTTSYDNTGSVTVQGVAEPSAIVSVSGGTSTPVTANSSTGSYSIVVTLASNTSNPLVVSQVDTSTNASSGTNRAVVHDNVLPTYTSASMSGATVTLTYSETLDSTSVPAAAAFTVSGQTVNSVAVTGSTVLLTLASPTTSSTGATTVSYNVPVSNKVQDRATNAGAAVTTQTVANAN